MFYILHSTGQHVKDIEIDMSSVFNPKWDFSTNIQVSQNPISTGKCLRMVPDQVSWTT